MGVTLFITKSKHAKLRPGITIEKALVPDDFVFAEDTMKIDVLVLKGNKHYPNGKQFSLFIPYNAPDYAITNYAKGDYKAG